MLAPGESRKAIEQALNPKAPRVGPGARSGEWFPRSGWPCLMGLTRCIRLISWTGFSGCLQLPVVGIVLCQHPRILALSSLCSPPCHALAEGSYCSLFDTPHPRQSFGTLVEAAKGNSVTLAQPASCGRCQVLLSVPAVPRPAETKATAALEHFSGHLWRAPPLPSSALKSTPPRKVLETNLQCCISKLLMVSGLVNPLASWCLRWG